MRPQFSKPPNLVHIKNLSAAVCRWQPEEDCRFD